MNKKYNETDGFRVWIELDNTRDPVKGKARADMANKMLERLGVTIDPMKGCGFEWHEHRHYTGTPGYIFNIGGGAFEEQSDNGRWFNLRFLATGEAFEG